MRPVTGQGDEPANKEPPWRRSLAQPRSVPAKQRL